MKSILTALVTCLASLSFAADSAGPHHLDMSSKPGWALAGEINGTYEIKNGSIKIQIKRGHVERTPLGNIPKRHVTGVVLSILRKSGDKTAVVAQGEIIVIDKILDVGKKYRLRPQTIIIEDASITPANAEKQWISASINDEINGQKGSCHFDDACFYGTKEKVAPAQK